MCQGLLIYQALPSGGRRGPGRNSSLGVKKILLISKQNETPKQPLWEMSVKYLVMPLYFTSTEVAAEEDKNQSKPVSTPYEHQRF